MSTLLRDAATLAELELRRLVRSRSTWTAVAIFSLFLAAGHFGYWRSAPPRPADDRLFVYGYLAYFLLVFRFGLAADRESGFGEYLLANFLSPGRYALGKTLAALLSLLGFATCAVALALALSLGDSRYAVWYAARLTLSAWLLAPLVLAAELLVDTRMPGVVAAIALVFVLLAAETVGGAERLVHVLGLDSQRLRFETLVPLILRDITIVPAALALLYLGWSRRLRRAARALRA